MAIKLGVVMDPISTVKVAKDSSMAMMLEAQERGYEIFYIEMQDLYLDQGESRASVKPVKVFDDANHWYELGEAQDVALADLDAIIMRKDPPFDTEYIYATYMLERAEEAGTLRRGRACLRRRCAPPRDLCMDGPAGMKIQPVRTVVVVSRRLSRWIFRWASQICLKKGQGR